LLLPFFELLYSLSVSEFDKLSFLLPFPILVCSSYVAISY
jgi:hypothetical protein